MNSLFFILALIGIVIIYIFLDIAVTLLLRRCSYCNKILRYGGRLYDENGKHIGWTFYCPHCGRVEKVTPDDIIKDKE